MDALLRHQQLPLLLRTKAWLFSFFSYQLGEFKGAREQREIHRALSFAFAVSSSTMA
ncbi:hypothetical protein [Bradyrhizobium sp. 143]|uniref:hypothetical protein n=1 Tax=Bradyrhizobium sp. 143 TaxID=2782619 RepID=UPI001FF6FC9B|nr:hypothetical protein [Bradyrhizobium sp. 143]MCK1715259.1 hypothetical protein [Bradyrhizobium sp. 143]